MLILYRIDNIKATYVPFLYICIKYNIFIGVLTLQINELGEIKTLFIVFGIS